MKPVLFNNTVLRDGHQSMAATRMATSSMLEPAPILDEMGFAGLETWGGATIDSCLRYLNENPFDRLRTLKKIAPKTPQLMLLRGQNIVQYASFPDDVVETFVRLTCENGQDILQRQAPVVECIGSLIIAQALFSKRHLRIGVLTERGEVVPG